MHSKRLLHFQHADWRVHSCSSQADVHSASNVLRDELYRIWQSEEPAEEAWLILEAQPPVAFNEIEIVNAGSALVEVFGLRWDRPSEEADDYDMLLSAQQLMSVKDLVNKANRNRVFSYHISNKLSQQAALHRWKKIRVFCRQPFGTEDHKTCIGLSRLKFELCKTTEELAAEAAEVRLQENLETGIAELFPNASSNLGQQKLSQVTDPTKRMTSSYVVQDHEPKMVDDNSASPSITHKRRKLPAWLSSSNQSTQLKKNIGDTGVESKHKIKSGQKSAENANADTLNHASSSSLGQSERHRGTDACQGIGKTQNIVEMDHFTSGSKRYRRGSTVAEMDRLKMDNSPDQSHRKEGKDTSIDSRTLPKANVRGGSDQDGKSYKSKQKGQPSESSKISRTGKGMISTRNLKVPEECHSPKGERYAPARKLDEEKKPVDSEATSKTRHKTEKGAKLGSSEGIKTSSHDNTGTIKLKQAEQTASPFSKLLDGVVFAISGLVNPERADLRDKALQMGGQYRPDWSSDCTILFCALANTPKFQQVKRDNGTIVLKDWILECHRHRELVEIDPYLMHAGKPWRRVGISATDEFDKEAPPTSSFASVKIPQNISSKECTGNKSSQTVASLSKVQQWAHEDVASSIAWLQQQESPPETEELKTIAIQGILLCLDEAISCLQKKQSVSSILETWAFVPRAVQELAAREDRTESVRMLSNEDILHEAERLKWIYVEVLKTDAEAGNLKFAQGKGKQIKDDDEEDEEEDDDATELMSDDRGNDTLDWESDGTEILDEDLIREAEENIRKMLRGYRISRQH